eukprot:499465-Amphidinium_carterae.1
MDTESKAYSSRECRRVQRTLSGVTEGTKYTYRDRGTLRGVLQEPDLHKEVTERTRIQVYKKDLEAALEERYQGRDALRTDTPQGILDEDSELEADSLQRVKNDIRQRRSEWRKERVDRYYYDVQQRQKERQHLQQYRWKHRRVRKQQLQRMHRHHLQQTKSLNEADDPTYIAEQPGRRQVTPPRPVRSAEMQTHRQKIVKLVPANFNCTDEEMTTRQLQKTIRNMHFKHHPTIDYCKLTNELRQVYDNFEFYDFFNDFKKGTTLCYKQTKYLPKASQRSSTHI